MAHNWTRGTPKAPPLPTPGTFEGVHYGHPSALGLKFHRAWEALWRQEDEEQRREMYSMRHRIPTDEMGDPIDEEKVEGGP
eukprot:4530172-Karenia_brevis.AAC.1